MPILDPQLFARERERQRLSVDDLAQESGLSVGRIGEIYEGSNATTEEVEALASALGVKPHDIDGSV